MSNTIQLKNSKWVNQQTYEFISQLSFDGYVLAGNSVANLHEGISLQGDLDFWIGEPKKFISAFKEMYKFYDKINIYPSMIELESIAQLPRLNLIYTNLNPFDTINRFDFDYCRCYWTPETGIIYGFGCKEAIKNKLIKYPTDYVNKFRIIKAIKYGYNFTKGFWSIKDHLLTKSRNWKYIKPNEPYYVSESELNMSKFTSHQMYLQLSDVYDVDNTIKEIAEQLEMAFKPLPSQVKIPLLISLDSTKDNVYKLTKEYIKKIILNNPMSTINYLEFNIGDYIVNLKEKSIPSIQIDYHPDKEDDLEEELEESEEEDETNKIVELNKRTNKTIKLNSSGSAYITIEYLPDELANYGLSTFGDLWALHPKSKHKIIMYEQEVEVNRYSQSYLNTPTNLAHAVSSSYMYSGFDTSNNNIELPEQFNKFYSHMINSDPKYNQVIANWYEGSNDYIAYHADCVKGMIPDAKIAILSLYPDTNPSKTRYLQIKPKNKVSALVDILTIRLDHGQIITMCNKTQDYFVHGILKDDKEVNPRISLSFRQMA